MEKRDTALDVVSSIMCEGIEGETELLNCGIER